MLLMNRVRRPLMAGIVSLAGALAVVASLMAVAPPQADAATGHWKVRVTWQEVQFAGLDDCEMWYHDGCLTAELYSSMSAVNVDGNSNGRGGPNRVRKISVWGGTDFTTDWWNGAFETVTVENDVNTSDRYWFAARPMCATDSFATACYAAQYAKNNNYVDLSGYYGDTLRAEFHGMDYDEGDNDTICNVGHYTTWWSTDITRLAGKPNKTETFTFKGGVEFRACTLRYTITLLEG